MAPSAASLEECLVSKSSILLVYSSSATMQFCVSFILIGPKTLYF